MKKHLPTVILIVVFLTGLSLLLYPTVSDWWNSFHQTRAIAAYQEAVSALDEEDYEEIRNAAVAYNEELKSKLDPFHPTAEETLRYNEMLNVAGNGIMGYIEIPLLRCELPFYHGTDEGVLAKAVGHIEGSSLPVGGNGTHCVLSGHRGLPSAKLFTDLDRLKEGDVFLLHVLEETLTYEVDQILIVEPDDISALAVDENKDYCTLVTCTPYGVNSHRLLVRGHRIPNQEGLIAVSADAVQYDPLLIAPLVAVPFLVVLFLVLLFRKPRRKGAKGKE